MNKCDHKLHELTTIGMDHRKWVCSRCEKIIEFCKDEYEEEIQLLEEKIGHIEKTIDFVRDLVPQSIHVPNPIKITHGHIILEFSSLITKFKKNIDALRNEPIEMLPLGSPQQIREERMRKIGEGVL